MDQTQIQSADAPAFPISGNPNVDKYNDYLNGLHREGSKHVENSRKMYLDLIKREKPTEKHRELGLGHLVVALAATALDPTHRAGAGYLDGVKGAYAERDARDNQRTLNRFNTQGQVGLAQSQFEGDEGNRLYAQEAQGRTRLDNYGKAQQAEHLKAVEQAQKDKELEEKDKDKAHAAHIKQVGLDINGFTKAYASAPTPAVKHITAKMFRNHFNGNKNDYAEAGFPDTTSMDQTIATMEKDSDLPTLKQQQLKSIDDSRKGNLTERKRVDNALIGVRDESVDVDKTRVKKLNQDMDFATKLFPTRYATAEANLRHINAMIGEVSARTAKIKSGGGKAKSLIGGFTKEEMQYMHSQNAAISQTMKENLGYIRDAEKEEKDNAFQARHGDQGAIARVKVARTKKASAQKYYKALQDSVHQVRKRLGVPVPTDTQSDGEGE